MSKATQCAEELWIQFQIRTSCCGHRFVRPEEIADVIRRFYPEEQRCTYQKDTETNSLRMIDEGRDV